MSTITRDRLILAALLYQGSETQRRKEIDGSFIHLPIDEVEQWLAVGDKMVRRHAPPQPPVQAPDNWQTGDPPEPGEYLVFAARSGYEVSEWFRQNDIGLRWARDDDDGYSQVIAWQPLPAPPTPH